jgi:dipeptidase D
MPASLRQLKRFLKRIFLIIFAQRLNFMNITELKPELVWNFFHQITQIPRPSKKEEKIKAFLTDYAIKNKLQYATDWAGNILIRKPGTSGYENNPVVVLQAHMDMVCEKNPDVVHDFENDPIKTIIDGDWVRATGTTLGADNGIGMALMLAVLSSDDLQHPPLECLFTVDEETGLTGANALQKNFITGTKLINLDSEDDGEIYIGCAGGIGTKAFIPYTKEKTPPEFFGFQVSVSGLKGGHSGGDIHLGLGNSIKILARYLTLLKSEMEVRLVKVEGGNLHNAIPREATAVVGVPYSQKERIRVLLNIFISEIESELKETDPGFSMNLQSESLPEEIINSFDSTKFISLLFIFPHGVISMSNDIPGLVETSTNLASVKMSPDNDIVIINTSQRSSSASAISDLTEKIKGLFILVEGRVQQTDGYPGWKPNLNSELLKTTQQAYETITGESAAVKAIHAGLECGLFLEKYPLLDMVSIGPQMYGVHSPDEKLSISSTLKSWNWLVEILRNL